MENVLCMEIMQLGDEDGYCILEGRRQCNMEKGEYDNEIRINAKLKGIVARRMR